MSEQPEYRAPSPADGPTSPARPGVQRETASGGRHGVHADAEPPDERHADRAAGGSGQSGPSERVTVPSRPRPSGLRPARPGRTRMSGTWVGVILGAVVLAFLLVFILQNLVPVQVSFLGWQATLPLGVWLLFAAIAGILLLAIPGLGRMRQWRRVSGRTRRMGG